MKRRPAKRVAAYASSFLLVSTVSAAAGCGRTLSASALNGFLERPNALLKNDSRRALVYNVREFSKEAQSHSALRALAIEARESDREEIGRGLAMAYHGCLAQRSELSRAIANLIGRMPEAVKRGFRQGLEATRPDAPGAELTGDRPRQEEPQRVFSIGVVHSLDQRSLKLADPFAPPFR